MYRFDLHIICPPAELVGGDSESIFSGEGISVDMSTTEKLIMGANDKSDAGEYCA